MTSKEIIEYIDDKYLELIMHQQKSNKPIDASIMLDIFRKTMELAHEENKGVN